MSVELLGAYTPSRDAKGEWPPVTALCFSPSGDWLLSGNSNGTLRLFDTGPTAVFGSLHMSTLFSALGHGCLDAAFLPHSDASLLMVPADAALSDIVGLDLETAAVKAGFHVPAGTRPSSIAGFTASRGAPVFAAGRLSGGYHFFHESCPRPVASLALPDPLHSASATFDATGRRIAIATAGAVSIYDWRALASGPSQTVPMASIRGVDLHPLDDRRLLVSAGAEVREVDLLTRRVVVLNDGNAVRHAATRCDAAPAKYSPDGAAAVYGCSSGRIVVLDPHSHHTMFTLRSNHDSGVERLAWHPQRSLMASACKVTQLWGTELTAVDV